MVVGGCEGCEVGLLRGCAQENFHINNIWESNIPRRIVKYPHTVLYKSHGEMGRQTDYTYIIGKNKISRNFVTGFEDKLMYSMFS